jgi:hypothetical protein
MGGAIAFVMPSFYLFKNKESQFLLLLFKSSQKRKKILIKN